ncbi:MAG TPA: tetratricopeptide repeat protein, partial [Kofleriaceae bacterium]
SPMLPPPARISIAGGVSRATGPSPLAIAGLVAASLVAGMAIYLAVHKNHGAIAHRHAGPAQLTNVPPQPSSFPTAGEDAGELAMVFDAAPTPDATRVAVPADAARAPVDAEPTATAPRDGARPDRNKEAASLRALAQAALDEGDPDKALDYADQSLVLRHTAQAYLVRANALTRLSRNDDALSALENAAEIVPNSPTVLYRKGMLLRSMKRFDEMKAAFQKFLAVAPDDAHAAEVRELVSQ